MQEMLTLIIQVVKERRFCGLTPSECLQRELIYKLSTGDATHSQLVKSLPRDLSKVGALQEILDTIAVYSNPSGMNQVCSWHYLSNFLLKSFRHFYDLTYYCISCPNNSYRARACIN